MHRLLIENYIKQISKQDIKEFANKNNIHLSEKDQDILYHYLMNNWQDLLYGNYRELFSELEVHIDKDKFLKIKDLFNFYFNKYQNLL